MVRATEVTHVEIEDATQGRKPTRARSVNRILDDALGAFIDVLDQHTLADMAKAPHPEPAAPRRKPLGATKPAAMAGQRYRRVLHDSG